jgi:predicted DNA-binding transcriptional regulator AlpA
VKRLRPTPTPQTETEASTPAPAHEYLVTSEVCALCRATRPTLRHWRRAGLIPEPVKIGRKLLWSAAAIRAHLARLAEGGAS